MKRRWFAFRLRARRDAGRSRGSRRRPGRMERVEHDLVDRPLGILMAIDRALDDVAQLADVAWPAPRLERGHCPPREARPVGPFELGRHAPAEMLREER